MRRMMIRGVLLGVAIILATSTHACADSMRATVVMVRGEVLTRDGEQKPYEKVVKNMTLSKRAQVVTREKSECVITFGTDREAFSTVSLIENSSVEISDVFPTTLALSKGRVFGMIKKLGGQKEFKVRTPTAIAGARGTGLGVGYENNMTDAACFEDTIFVQGLDGQGNVTGEQDVGEGFGMEIGEGGALGGLQGLTDEQREDWQNFLNTLGGLGSGAGGGADGEEDDDATFEQEDDIDTTTETQGTFRDFRQEDNREGIEDNTPGSGGGSSDGGGQVRTKG